MLRYEYEMVHVNSRNKIRDVLNAWGRQGWAVVCPVESDNYSFLLMRPLDTPQHANANTMPAPGPVLVDAVESIVPRFPADNRPSPWDRGRQPAGAVTEREKVLA